MILLVTTPEERMSYGMPSRMSRTSMLLLIATGLMMLPHLLLFWYRADS